ncbi:hypothetical protein Bca52824_057519 [Brassica carinata]|uniref:Uncharacterized protein n=1 Tax=Brassica carinata TaxID=52824 RepID=A0A8X7UDV8_BRACI|nr:hypothetical protein Bca52824_057519 [Brassica carinata]
MKKTNCEEEKLEPAISWWEFADRAKPWRWGRSSRETKSSPRASTRPGGVWLEKPRFRSTATKKKMMTVQTRTAGWLRPRKHGRDSSLGRSQHGPQTRAELDCGFVAESSRENRG